jgi:ElaB/YqjD/DUF883 family membrane-anchored ribosome-binding protein
MQHVDDVASDAVDKAGDTIQSKTQRARKGIYDVMNDVSDSAEKASTSAGAFVQRVQDNVEDATDDLRSTDASQIADTVKQKASDVGQQVTATTDAALNTAGQRIEHFASSVRTNAPSGTAGEVATKAADALEQSGQYLQQTSTSNLVSDVTDLVRRRPIPSLLVALGVGYLVVRALRGNNS